MPPSTRAAAPMTSSMKISRAASTVATCRSVFEPKWANRPLLLTPELAGEPADREALEALRGGDLDGLVEDRPAACGRRGRGARQVARRS